MAIQTRCGLCGYMTFSHLLDENNRIHGKKVCLDRKTCIERVASTIERRQK